MNVLIIGSGGREHAMVKKTAESPRVKELYCAPGNPGMAGVCTCVDIKQDDIEGLARFAKAQAIDLTIVGPELPLTLGIVDVFKEKGLLIFGPDRRASILEGSKIFTKEFSKKYSIPTAAFETFDDAARAVAFLDSLKKYPVVIKADGLASGKGVIIAKDHDEAVSAVRDMMIDKNFGTAGQKILIEDYINGHEASFIVVSDGKHFSEFSSSQDHKRLLDNDLGPNTGGMGAFAPATLVTPRLREKIINTIIRPTLTGMEKEGRPYTGFLYAGVMVDEGGEPLLLEYNCRLGDPEAEVILPLLKSDFIDFVMHSLDGTLKQYQPAFHEGSAVCVVLASQGYPAAYQTGFEISGLDSVTDPDCFVFHAGTATRNGRYITNGGRVLTVTARGDDLCAAVKRVYQNTEKIYWQGVHYRRDIAQKGLNVSA
ncbi:MAG: phosphoribosylamine--glycine ligase [Deltaproteobacteria bacterium]|nr:phosphoribosylamine--glycine ligase [Deltaproteobacteria bacterium]